jgi:hypothetical protein
MRKLVLHSSGQSGSPTSNDRPIPLETDFRLDQHGLYRLAQNIRGLVVHQVQLPSGRTARNVGLLD